MRKAVVVGAGIGGVTTAVALQRRGWQVTVLERAEQLGEVGAGLSIWHTAAEVLRQLGVEGVEAGPRSPGRWGMRLADGRWILQAEDLGATAPVMIHRATLHRRITDQLGPEVTVRAGFTVTAVEQDATGATVRGSDGEVRADLVVAADGIRSTLRAAMHPRYRGPQYAGYTSWRGLADVELSDGGGETWGRGRRFGFARLIDGPVYWYATANQAAHQTSGLAAVTATFGTWHDPIPTILAATTHLLQADTHDLHLPLVPFVTGRVVLLGDAAHAMTPNLGRGACSAIEDADSLTRHLDNAPLAEALAAYDRERRRETTRLLRISRRVGQLGQVEGRVLGGARDGLLTVAGMLTSLRRPPTGRRPASHLAWIGP